MNFFLLSHASKRVCDLNIEWLLVVKDDWICCFKLFPDPLVLQFLFSNVKGGVRVKNIMITAKVWNWVVNWMSFEIWMFKLSATGGGADWITLLIKLNKDISIMVGI